MTLLMQKVVIAIVLCLHMCLSGVFGQQKGLQAEHVTYTDLVKKGYGLDQDLVNGLQYYNRYIRCKGDPYFQSNHFRKGSITIEGEIFYDVRLKFDIHSQHVELEYKNFSGGSNRVVTIFDRVDAFFCGEHQFQKLSLDKGSEKYYQVIPTACFTIYVFWEKELVPVSGNTTYTDQFTDARHSFWLNLNGEILPFNSRKDFTEYFPEEQKKEIKHLLKRNQFKFRTAQVGEVTRNMQAVCNLMEGREIN